MRAGEATGDERERLLSTQIEHMPQFAEYVDSAGDRADPRDRADAGRLATGARAS